MGVPGFVRWLLEKYKRRMILNEFPKEVQELYLDSNCLFHPQCFKVLDLYPKWKDLHVLESKMIRRILKYIDYLVLFTRPTELLYISVDGVAPMAKIVQQRQRRFRAVQDNETKDDIKRKFDVPITKKWNNSAITPGTKFMETLHKAIVKHFEKHKQSFKVVISSYHTPGEGEHKILQEIRNSKQKKTRAIYGLDADLIFLSLSCGYDDVYLLREAMQFGKFKASADYEKDEETVTEPLNVFSIDELKNRFNDTMTNMLRGKGCDIKKASIQDFIFVCYFLGNDFLPHLPSIHVRRNGLDTLLDIYTNIYPYYGSPLLRSEEGKVTFNFDFLYDFIGEIASRENYYFVEELPRYLGRESKRRCHTSEPYEYECWKLECLKFPIDDPIKLGYDNPTNWKFRYYNHYFNVTDQDDLIDSMCAKYLEGLIWVSMYYFDDCASWLWAYPYTHAPFMSDLYYFLGNHKSFMSDISFPKTKAIKPCTLLLMATPRQCSYLLPESYKSLLKDTSDIIDMYPDEVEIDLIYKTAHWEGIPMLPFPDIDRIKRSVKKCKLTHDEKIRNKIHDPTIMDPEKS
jgi:5'-3' exoribonuclease 1